MQSDRKNLTLISKKDIGLISFFSDQGLRSRLETVPLTFNIYGLGFLACLLLSAKETKDLLFLGK
jgi:hypothetical protein